MRGILRDRRGFSFLEMVVALAILGAVIAFLAPTLLSTVNASRSDATLAEMQQIYTAIFGDQRTTFGYVGDVGAYPTTLKDLVVAPNPAVAGWNGPYLSNPRVNASNNLIDPYGQPYEFYVVSGVSGSDQLAIVSRGPDGLSTNGTADPNVASNFATTPPTPAASTYFSGTNNADNIVYPTPSATNANAVNSVITGTLALNIQNFDSNALVNAFVPACPGLYQVTVTSQPRGTNEITNLGYSPGFQIDLPQGVYQILVTALNLATAPFNEKLTVIPNETLTRSPNITGLDSSGTDTFLLTVTNKQPTEAIEIFEFTTKLTVQPPSTGTQVPAANGVRSFSVHGCAQVFAKKAGATTIRDQLVMPFAASSKNVGSTSATIAVTNNYTDKIKLFNNDIFFAEVDKGKTKTFTVGLVAGDVIKSYDRNVTLLLKTVTLVTGGNTFSVP